MGNDAVLRGVNLDNLELDLPHATTDDEEVSLTDRPVGLTEVRRKENVEEGAGNTLDSIGDGKDRDPLGL